MLPFGLTLGLFALWTCVGLGVVGLLRVIDGRLLGILLAPLVGLSVTLLTVFLVNRFGMPLGVAGLWILVLLVLATGLMLWRGRPEFAWREYAPFAVVFVLGLLVTARPMLEFGLDWVSYSNDDMANYTLGATRMVNYGFFEIPSLDDLLSRRDYSLTFWFFNVGIRPGSELMIAWVAGLSGLDAHQVFMPLISAFHMTLLSSTAALAYQATRNVKAAFLSSALLAISALGSLGVLYQLIAQVGGLAFLAGSAVILMRPFEGVPECSYLKYGILIAIVCAGLLVIYPEVTPFLGLAWLLQLAVLRARKRLVLRPMVRILGVAILAGVVLLNTYAASSLVFLTRQASAGMLSGDLGASLFPYYLLPTGLANLWGFQSIVKVSGEPWLSLSIALGGTLLTLALFAAARDSWRGNPAGLLTLVMLVVSVPLFAGRAGFGLFKMAMYLQPFLLTTLVVVWLQIVRRPSMQIAPLVALGLLGLNAQVQYVDRSRGVPGPTEGGLTEIFDASQSRINAEFNTLVQQQGSSPLVLDTSNLVLAKFQAMYVRGHISAFTSADFSAHMVGAEPRPVAFRPDLEAAARFLQGRYLQQFATLNFDMHDPREAGASNQFMADMGGQPPQIDATTIRLISTTHRQNLLNRWATESYERNGPDFVARPWKDVSNFALFVVSTLGQPYYSYDPFLRRRVALYQLEPDLFFDGDSMAGLGRYMTMQVVNPSPSVRLVLDLTASLKGDGHNTLPLAEAIGSTRVALPLLGRGSARVFSPPLQPQIIAGRAFVMLDMGEDGAIFSSTRTGLMNLFGTDIPLDGRRLVAFGRDISLISEDQYARLSPPTNLNGFPGALADRQLEYSGIYEDGWVSEAAFVRLSQPDAEVPITVRGMLPLDKDPGETTEVQIFVDGQAVLRRIVSPGEFDLSAHVPGLAGPRRVELRFNRTIRLTAPDSRLAAARLSFIGFDPNVSVPEHP